MISRSKNTKTLVSTLAIALVVILAGCAGIGSFGGASSDQPATVNDQDQPESPDSSDESTPIPSSENTSHPNGPTAHLDGVGTGTDRPVGPFPAGTSTQGISDPTALIAAHLGVLDDSSYTVSRAETHTTTEYTYSMESTLAVQDKRQRLAVDYAGQSQDIYRADNASPSYIRWESETGVRYLRDEGDVLFPGESAFFIQSVLEASTLEFVEQRTIDNHPVFVFSVASFSSSQNLRDSTPLESVEDLEGTIYVRDDGLIAGTDVVVTGPDFEGVRTELRIDEAFTEIGTTVITEPNWLGEAHERAARLTAEVDPEGTYISVTMEHGDPIPAGSTGFLYIEDISLETAFPDGLDAGHAFYLFESTDGELTVSLTAPSSTDIGAPVPDYLQEMSVAIFNQEYGTVYASTLAIHRETPQT